MNKVDWEKVREVNDMTENRPMVRGLCEKEVAAYLLDLNERVEKLEPKLIKKGKK